MSDRKIIKPRPVVCRKCGNEAVKSSALGKEFYYCRTCKVEVLEDTSSPYWSSLPPDMEAQFKQTIFYGFQPTEKDDA